MRRDEAIARLKQTECTLRGFGVTALYLFGSHARDEATPESDIDVFVDPAAGQAFGFLPFMDSFEAIQHAVGEKVDYGHAPDCIRFCVRKSSGKQSVSSDAGTLGPHMAIGYSRRDRRNSEAHGTYECRVFCGKLGDEAGCYEYRRIEPDILWSVVKTIWKTSAKQQNSLTACRNDLKHPAHAVGGHAQTLEDPMPLMPALFIGHGSPTNALEDNEFTRAWRGLADRFEKPKAIVCVSAHWETKGLLITAAERQRTIHDFYNFPRAMYEFEYPAPGDPALARRIETMLAPYARADLDGWGLDHGAWSILCHMYPRADIPVVMVSQDVRATPAEHYAVGRALGALRDDGVLVLGSGNIVHNLRQFVRGSNVPHPWAQRFNGWVKDKIAAKDHAALMDFRSQGADAALAVPEAEHYTPLLYVLGAQRADEAAEIFTDQVTSGISMTSVGLGLAA